MIHPSKFETVMPIATKLPRAIQNKLFGEREKYGTHVQPNDPDWSEWLSYYLKFYQDTQKRGVSKWVNRSGYKILRQISLEKKKVLEIGPGDMPHVGFWIGKPNFYYVCDIREEFLLQSQKLLDKLEIPNTGIQVDSPILQIDDQSLDVIIAFYVLEHLDPLNDYIDEFIRILKPGGLLIGGIPTEGGVGWGLGRYFSSRRYILKTSNLNPDKIICWEHPNFAQSILNILDIKMKRKVVSFWPFKLPNIDINLLVRLIYEKPE
ncbi:MAG: class I SAM-dependent methyltransferase [Nitrosopumilales archaeon]|nr:MAG: class I SAM-dependent methyltransferase [Nitrosopumilales archaeon]